MEMTELDLGDRMKFHERATGSVLERRKYYIVRADGRAFHSYTRDCETPFDAKLAEAMNHVAEKLCSEISGAAFAFTQSDEVSVLASDLTSPDAEPWFGGRVQKIASVAAAIASVEFVKNRGTNLSPVFDARVFTLPDEYEVGNYFRWRQRDATKNSVSMAAHKYFSRNDLHGVNTSDRILMLNSIGRPWSELPDDFRYGRMTIKESYQDQVHIRDKRTRELRMADAIRTRWTTKPAPLIDDWGYGLLVEHVRSINKGAI